MSDADGAPGTATLARALVWSELRGQSWRLFAFPGLMGGLALLPVLASAFLGLDVASGLDPATRDLLVRSAGEFIVGPVDDRSLLVVLLVVQGPFVVTMFGALLGLLIVQSGVGKRTAAGEFELLLSGPYRERDVFAALVAASFALALLAIALLVVLVVGGSLLTLTTVDVALSGAAIQLVLIGLVAPVPMALWATFVTVVLYLVFPEAATNNAHPGNLLALLSLAPALGLLLVAVTGLGVDPFVLVVAANLVPLGAIAVGWATVRRWFSVQRLL
jgi:ethanolamine transporter